ncbi:cytochrome-c peroxidase [Flavihumibacter rivuli]|uniref:cytochrome-c peroxidase n=1 Tax=Flavihumibacter rivuli TaxID=2838156 RepID=UPI001BDF1C22|nr:cytochrome c peroxidase [Flavihumibacter rivuli]ULQ54993.1 cytochrome-c peroxidase [Flavihumibacter rivuli]
MRKLLVISSLVIAVCCSLLVQSCNKGGGENAELTFMDIPQPAGFPPIQYDVANNPISKEGFELGRKLFYDGRLSKDGNFPCASCHQQFAAFATFEHDFSHGFNNQFTTRNAPGLFNLAWHKEMHHDGGIAHLDLQPLAPITAPNEMGETIPAVLKKIGDDPDYRQHFQRVFGNEEVTTERMTKALSQFMVMMVSATSKYDQVKAGKASFDVNEEAGYAIFKNKCASCHKEPLFTDLQYRNNGLPMHPTLKDVGRMRITGSSQDSLKFKVPSLRNVMVTYPYMHDGRFGDISNVYEHYNSGIQFGPTTDPLLKTKIPLSATERGLLTEFLKTLTDAAFNTDPRFAAPQ